jgi:ribosomal protein L15
MPLQPGDRASAVTRKRVEREEQCGGIKRRARGHQSGAGQAGVKRRRQRQAYS